MLQVTTPDLTTWDTLLPEPARRLPDELARIDAYLDDERFIAPWRALFDQRLGRPSIPVPTLVRLLYLKHRSQLGYQTLVWEVGDSITWRRFARIPLDQPVPHPTTLVKLVGRAGPGTITQLNEALLGKLAGDKLLRGRKLRIDTTVVEADIDYPTDDDLLGPAGPRGPQARWAGRSGQSAQGGEAGPVPGPPARRRAAVAPARPGAAPTGRGDGRDRPAHRRAGPARPCHTPRRGRTWTRSCPPRAGALPAGRPTGGCDAWSPPWPRPSTAPSGCWPRPPNGWPASAPSPTVWSPWSPWPTRTRCPIRKGKPRAPTEFGSKLLVAEDDRGLSPTTGWSRATHPTRHNCCPPSLVSCA
jgi:transposase, IS5 family